jgi:hypothetical protein
MIYRQINKLVKLYKIELTITIINLALISTSVFTEYEKYKQRDKVGDKIIYDGKDRLIRREGYKNSYIVDNESDIDDLV